MPILFEGPFDTTNITTTLTILKTGGSIAAPGYPFPEGIVIYHVAARIMFKKTILDDEKPKGAV